MNPTNIIRAIRYFGIHSVFLGTWHRVAKKTRLLKRRFPTCNWDDLHLEFFVDRNVINKELRKMLCPAKFFPLGSVCQCKTFFADRTGIERFSIETADNITRGNFKYFSKLDVQQGLPINWHLNPFSDAEWPKDVHWCDTSCFVKEYGDIKCVWEISRFSWAYELVRAYALTGDEKYSRNFWEFFEHWLENNQPNEGVNWVSGQECALRLMAWCFALFGFLNSPSTSEEQIRRLLLAVAIHGERIEKFISHAVRQKTNHALTEAAGLYTLGIMFPFFKKAQRWKNLGKKVLEKEGFRQIYEDGSYVQQSMNYHRVMLHSYLWCLRLAEINGDGFSVQLKEQLLHATEFLYQIQDDSTGRVPNYGPNDGALILPLNSCDYLDYRPVIHSCWYLLKRERLYDTGPWDEDLFWLFGPAALNAPKVDKQRVSCKFRTGGYYTLRAKTSWGMIRCHTYCDRVGHVDPLHLDLWADGINLLRDCGTYKYYAPNEPELEYYFKSIWAHNTVIVDGKSPVQLASRFMWLPWPKAELAIFEIGREKINWKGKHFAYHHFPDRITHTRQVIVDRQQDRWEIRDELGGSGSHKLELRWHLPANCEVLDENSHSMRINLEYGWYLEVKSQDNIKAKMLKSAPNGGWESLYYSDKQPICTLSVIVSSQLPSTFKTIVYREREK